MQTGSRLGSHFSLRLKFNNSHMGITTLRRLEIADHDFVAHRIVESWGAEIVVVHQTIYRPAELPGFIVQSGRKILGLITFHIDECNACEIVTLNSWSEGRGVGTELVEAVKQIAQRKGCKRLWLITTNDKLKALHFYQKRGFVIASIHINAVDKARLLKPEIPLIGLDGIPLRDEIEMEIAL